MSDPPRRTEIDDLLDSAGVVLHEPADTDLHPAPADLEWGAEAGSADSTDSPATDVEPGDDADHTPAAPTRPRKSVAAAMIEWLVVVAVAVTAALLVKAYVVQQFQVSGDSMRMTLHDGDRVLVNKLSYRMHDPNRGDVVVLKTMEGADERDPSSGSSACRANRWTCAATAKCSSTAGCCRSPTWTPRKRPAAPITARRSPIRSSCPPRACSCSATTATARMDSSLDRPDQVLGPAGPGICGDLAEGRLAVALSLR